jgi:hypothetical protein
VEEQNRLAVPLLVVRDECLTDPHQALLPGEIYVRRPQAEAEEAGRDRQQPGALEEREHEPR